MRMRGIFIIVLVMLALFACGCGENGVSQPSTSNNDATLAEERTSIFALIIDPEAYDGQQVTVRGAFYLDGDGAALYATPDDGEYMLTINALWMGEQSSISAYTMEELKALNGEYVEVTGTVKGTAYGPEDAYNCELTDIKIILKLEPVNPVPEE